MNSPVRLPEVDDGELMQMARRVAEVMNLYHDQQVTPGSVNLQMISDLCWALGITSSVVIAPHTEDR